MRIVALILFVIFATSCGDLTSIDKNKTRATEKERARTDFGVSGPSYCASFDLGKMENKAENGELDAIRSMRDYYLDCDLGRSKEKILRWASAAAQHGDEKDRNEYASIKMNY
ncbi:MAG: hypothetical protein V4673_07570 [Pseudomonadota bacterium]